MILIRLLPYILMIVFAVGGLLAINQLGGSGGLDVIILIGGGGLVGLILGFLIRRVLIGTQGVSPKGANRRPGGPV
jgi:NhaP-type Na+/H+ or K+/H+ antiporter